MRRSARAFLVVCAFLVLPTIANAKDVVVPPHSDPAHPVLQFEFPVEELGGAKDRTVILLLSVDDQGRVIDSTVDRSTGSKTLDDLAVTASLAWKLLPGTVNAKPVTMKNKFGIVFHNDKIRDDENGTLGNPPKLPNHIFVPPHVERIKVPNEGP